MEVLLTSLSPVALLAGKVLALGAGGLIQIGTWIAAVALIGPRVIEQIPDAGDLQFAPETFPLMILFFIAGYLLFAVTFAGIGAATTSAREAGPITAIVTLPAIIPVYLSSVLLSDPDGTLARTLSFIPFSAPTTMIQWIGSGGVSTKEALASLAITALAAGVMLFGVGFGPLLIGTLWRDRSSGKLMVTAACLVFVLSALLLLQFTNPLIWGLFLGLGMAGGMVQPLSISLAEKAMGNTSHRSIAIVGLWGEGAAALIYYMIGDFGHRFGDLVSCFAVAMIFCSILLLIACSRLNGKGEEN